MIQNFKIFFFSRTPPVRILLSSSELPTGTFWSARFGISKRICSNSFFFSDFNLTFSKSIFKLFTLFFICSISFFELNDLNFSDNSFFSFEDFGFHSKINI